MLNNHQPIKSITHWLTTTAVCSSLMMSSVSADEKNEPISFLSENNPELIIKFKKNQPNLRIFSQINEINARYNTQLQLERNLGSGAQLLKIGTRQPEQTIHQLITQLEKDPNVEYAVPNYRLYTLATPNDPRYNEQWHYYESTAGINTPAAWDITEGSGATIAVVDTGYRPHADLAANIIDGYDFISDAGTARDGNGRDPDAKDEGDWFGFFECPGAPFNSMNSSWHGTHVAGTIAAINNNNEGVAGIATKAKILPVRVLGKCGGTLADIQDGMLWAAGISISGAPDNPNPADVINLSLGGGAACDSAMQDVVNQITAAGTLVVAAAGNSNADASGFTPASCDNVLTVASVNRNGGKASYSNYGNVVEVAAPGGETASGSANGVLSTLNTGTQTPENDTYAFYQGTSMAAPHAAGVAGLLYAYKPSTTPAEVTQVLMDTARAFSATCSQCGTGIIDAHAALLALGNDENVPPTAGFTYSVSGLNASFSDSSTDSDGSIVSWSWSFGDGNNASSQNPSHSYTSGGTYSVTLIVTDDDGASSSSTQNVSVSDDDNIPPTASFSFSATELSVQFIDQSVDSDGNIASWSWNFGDGNISSQQDPSHIYAAEGTYTVSLTVTDDSGASHSVSQPVTVTAPPGDTINLSASVSSFWFIHTITLNWDGAGSSSVDVYRNGSLLATTANDGNWSEVRYFSGSGSYKICEAGTQNCSTEVSVSY